MAPTRAPVGVAVGLARSAFRLECVVRKGIRCSRAVRVLQPDLWSATPHCAG